MRLVARNCPSAPRRGLATTVGPTPSRLDLSALAANRHAHVRVPVRARAYAYTVYTEAHASRRFVNWEVGALARSTVHFGRNNRRNFLARSLARCSPFSGQGVAQFFDSWRRNLGFQRKRLNSRLPHRRVNGKHRPPAIPIEENSRYRRVSFPHGPQHNTHQEVVRDVEETLFRMEFHLHNRVALIFNFVYGTGWLEYREESETGKERTRPENYRPGYSSAIEELTFPGLA